MTKAFGMTGSSAPETRALMIGIKNVIVQYRETCWDTVSMPGSHEIGRIRARGLRWMSNEVNLLIDGIRRLI